jgi:hypothetical protein
MRIRIRNIAVLYSLLNLDFTPFDKLFTLHSLNNFYNTYLRISMVGYCRGLTRATYILCIEHRED